MVIMQNTTKQSKLSFCIFCFCLLLVALLTGCSGGLSQNARQSLSVFIPYNVNFTELNFYAVRAKSAYDSPSDIKRTYPDVTRVITLLSVDVRYFIETDHKSQTQTISVRGTADKPNFWEDFEIALIKDPILGRVIHGGFQRDALSVWADAKPHLRQDYSIRLTGHSLGAAIALILGAYADAEGFTVSRIINFGQPKVTSEELSPKLSPVTTRVINNLDPVPMLPPPGFIPQYRHLGPEVILRPGKDYVYLHTHDANRVSIDDFWREFSHFSFKEPRISDYIINFQYKIKNGTQQVPYLGNGIQK